ncbi:hypothetical protein ACXR6G_19395 [Ancylomarina sp. YFZ004]
MKKNRVFRFMSFVSVICIIGSLALIKSCKKDVEPIQFYTPEAVQTAEILVLNSETRVSLSDVVAKLTYPDGSTESLLVSFGVLTLDVKSRDDGVLTVLMEREGFVSKTCTITIDRSAVAEGSDWNYYTTVLMAEVNESVTVDPTVETNVDVEGSDAVVVFPAGCVTESVEISITETPAAAEIAAESNEVELIDGHIALKSFSLLPEGQTFEIPIEITFPIPGQTGKKGTKGSLKTVSDDYTALLVSSITKSVVTIDLDQSDGMFKLLLKKIGRVVIVKKDKWKNEGFTLSQPIFFSGVCDEELVAIISQSFDSSTTQAADDLKKPITTSFTKKKKVKAQLGYYRTISGQYTIKHLRNVTKGYTIDIPKTPVIWGPRGRHRCHTGGSGN